MHGTDKAMIAPDLVSTDLFFPIHPKTCLMVNRLTSLNSIHFVSVFFARLSQFYKICDK